jgi:hydrogenase maturation protease
MRPLIIGIGNDLRGDDAVGLQIARRLAAEKPSAWDVCEGNGDALTLIEAWQGREAVIIVDVTQAVGAPGTVRRLDANAGPLNAIMNDVSSHGLGLGYSLELARSLAKLPKHCIVVVVEGADFSIGNSLSPEVALAIPEILECVRRESEELTTQ